MFLGDQLERFLEHLEVEGVVGPFQDEGSAKGLVDAYLEAFKAEIARKVGRYRRKVKKLETPG